MEIGKFEIGRFFRAAGDVLLPRACAVCGRRLNLDEEHLCLGCLIDMPLTRFWARDRNPMADKFNEKIQRWIEAEEMARKERNANASGGLADGSGIEYEHYAYAAALFVYHSEAGFRHIPYQIKYQGNIGIGKYFGRMLGRKLAEEGDVWTDVDLVIPVPLHWTRRWKRGYNQAEVIAGAVAESLGTEMRSDILIRKRRTKTQVKLNIEEKARNVDGAFAVAGKIMTEMERLKNEGNADEGLSGVRHIAVVDDVFTTGSTLTACFSALRTVFPPSVRISVLTLGYLER